MSEITIDVDEETKRRLDELSSGAAEGVIEQENWDNYKKWAAEQVCQGCGAQASERKLGKCWRTEDWCGCTIEGGYVDTRPRFWSVSDGGRALELRCVR